MPDRRMVFAGLVHRGRLARAAALECEVLAVGHGLAVIIQTPAGQTIVYDCGRMGDPSVGRRIIAPALWARGTNRIDTVFLSHADHDHYNGLPDLLERFAVGKVCVPAGFAGTANPMAVELMEQIKGRRVALEPIAAPAAWSDGDVQFTVLHPTSGWHPETSDNARSLVLDVAYAKRRLLLTGDLEQLGLAELVAKPAPPTPVDVFLSPHHGGKSANPERLYEWAKPRLVVVSQRQMPRATAIRWHGSSAREFPCCGPGSQAPSTCNGRAMESAHAASCSRTATEINNLDRSMRGCRTPNRRRRGPRRLEPGFWPRSPVSDWGALRAWSWRWSKSAPGS